MLCRLRVLEELFARTKLNCFNFGVLTATTEAVILVGQYQAKKCCYCSKTKGKNNDGIRRRTSYKARNYDKIFSYFLKFFKNRLRLITCLKYCTCWFNSSKLYVIHYDKTNNVLWAERGEKGCRMCLIEDGLKLFA